MVFGHKKNTDIPTATAANGAGVAPSETATQVDSHGNNNTHLAATGAAPPRGKGGIGGHEKFSFAKWIKLWGPDL